MNRRIEFNVRYLLESVNPETGKRTPLSGWSPNVMLTSGLNQMANFSWFTACQVGNDNTAPASGDTGLLGYVAGTSTVLATDFGAQASAEFYGWKRKTFRFPIGSVSGNLTEVGVGWSVDSGANLVSRALVVDVNGTPNAATPKIDEYLDITAEVRCYPQLTQSTGTVDFNGVTYNYTLISSEVTSSTAWASNIGEAMSNYCLFVSDWAAYDGTIGTIEQAPSGVVANSDNTNAYNAPYSNNSFELVMGMNVGPSGWNLVSGGIKSLRMKSTHGSFQVEFDTVVPKTSSFTMQAEFTLSWGEKV